MINVDNADAFFAGSTRHASWMEFSAEQRKAAIEQAKRDFSRAFGRVMQEDEGQYRYGDQVRDEYAVYEQALYTLLRDAQPNGVTGSDIPSLNPDEKQSVKNQVSTGKGKWSEEALAWLGIRGGVQIVLG